MNTYKTYIREDGFGYMEMVMVSEKAMEYSETCYIENIVVFQANHTIEIDFEDFIWLLRDKGFEEN